MTKVCGSCKKEKSIESFHRHSKSSDGRNPRCSICINNQQKILRKKNKEKADTSVKWFSNIRPTKNDYYEMYLFLQSIGYDPSKDIHKQFCDKYDLPYKAKVVKGTNHYTWNDFIKTDE